nr:ion channel [Candidatus Gracilibacteria bacterium]
MFFIIFFTIMMYSTIYAGEIHGGGSYFIENGKKILDLPYFDAMYFSISTLTTVGYGDIAPVGIFRLFASIEIFTGLIYTGTMVYIFTNHLDKNE